MKVRLYARDMNLNRKDKKKVCRNTKFDFLGNKTVKHFFPVQMFYSLMGYLAIIIFKCPAKISKVTRGTLSCPFSSPVPRVPGELIGW